MKFLIIIGFRIFWQVWANIFTCGLFWGVFMFLSIKRTIRVFEKATDTQAKIFSSLFEGLFYIGAGFNAIVTLANGGFMPTLGEESFSIWVSSTSASNLLWMGDIYRIGGAIYYSMGDVFILTSFALPFALIVIMSPLFLLERITRNIERFATLNKYLQWVR